LRKELFLPEVVYEEAVIKGMKKELLMPSLSKAS